MFSTYRAIAVGGLLAFAASGTAFAQAALVQHPMPVDLHSAMHAGTVPTLPGQDAFGAIQEIVHEIRRERPTSVLGQDCFRPT